MPAQLAPSPAKRRAERLRVTVEGRGSDNVFADLGFAAPEEELNKAQLASHIRQIIKRRRLTQAAAVSLMAIDQPNVSALLNGRLANFSALRHYHAGDAPCAQSQELR